MSPMLDIQRRHAEVFRIRLGDKDKRGYPRKLTEAIRITSPNRSVIDAFVEVYGGEALEWEQQWQAYLPVTSLPVMVLPGQSITQWWELYRKTVCERRCDGYTESLSGRPCMCPDDITGRMQKEGACRPMTRISVVCPEVAVVGAGSLVSHGMIAAETLPQSVSVAMAALERGLMVPAVLRIIVHEGKRHYVVPQLEIVGVSLNALTMGEVPTPAVDAPAPRAIGSGGGEAPASQHQRGPTSSGAGNQAAPARALPPLPGDEKTCTACAGPLGTDPVRKGGGGFVHVACPTPPAHPGGPADATGSVVPSGPVARPPSEAQRRALMAASTAAYPDRDARLTWAGDVLGRRVDSFAALPAADAAALLAALDKSPAASPAGGTTAPGAERLASTGPAPAPTLLEEVGR